MAPRQDDSLGLALPDGRTIADAKLDPEPSVAESCVLKSGDQYFLVTNQAAERTPQPAAPRATGARLCLQGDHPGRLYAFDSHGQLQWPTAVTIQNQHLLLNQPPRLPVLTLACQVCDQRPNSPGRYQVKVFCVDKRTGRTIYRKNFDNPTGVFSLVGDPENKTVSLNLQRNKVTLTFTDKPLPPAAAADEKLRRPGEGRQRSTHPVEVDSAGVRADHGRTRRRRRKKPCQ